MRAQAGASVEGPLKKGETGLFALIVYAHGGLPVVNLISSAGDSEPEQLCSVKKNVLSFAKQMTHQKSLRTSDASLECMLPEYFFLVTASH